MLAVVGFVINREGRANGIYWRIDCKIGVRERNRDWNGLGQWWRP